MQHVHVYGISRYQKKIQAPNIDQYNSFPGHVNKVVELHKKSWFSYVWPKYQVNNGMAERDKE